MLEYIQTIIGALVRKSLLDGMFEKNKKIRTELLSEYSAPLYNVVKSVFDAHGYEFYEELDRPNIFGIRTGFAATDKFDDWICVAVLTEDGPKVYVFEGTTDPGIAYLKKPINRKGTAILCEGQHKDAYMIGVHMTYKALVQAGNKVRVYRDNDKDTEYDFIGVETDEGWFGINIHKRKGSDDQIRGASAGCQVFRFAADFDFVMKLAKKWNDKMAVALGKSKRKHREKFNYTLFNASSFQGVKSPV